MTNVRSPKHRRGFTLIELLVVIAIIGLLSAIVLASLNTAKLKANDSARKTELLQLRTALELYATDHNGQYPPPGTGGGCGPWCYSHMNPSGYIAGLVPKYISALPIPPGGNSSTNNFLYSSRGGDNYMSYKLMTLRPQAETVDGNSPWARCSSALAASCPATAVCGGTMTGANNPAYFSIASGSTATCSY